MINTDSLYKALSSLKTALAVAGEIENKKENNYALWETVRAGVIQNFEFSYELSWKLMKRVIEEIVGKQAVEGVYRRELFRVAAENGLIDDPEQWMKYHAARNITSHAYNEEYAEEVYGQAVVFYEDAVKLFKKIEEKNNANRA